MSDLGDWSLAGNFAAILERVGHACWDLFVIVGAYFIQRVIQKQTFHLSGGYDLASALCRRGRGRREYFSDPIHLIFALVAFVFGAASVIISYKLEKSPLSYISVILGAVTLSAVVLFNLGYSVDSGFYLGLGLGGMECFIIYPVLLWVLGFGAYLIGNPSDTATKTKA